jgi:hypothetical protein
MKQKTRSTNVVVIILLATAFLLASCAGQTPRVQRDYGAPQWRQQIELGCAKHYGIVLEDESAQRTRNLAIFPLAGLGVIGGGALAQESPTLALAAAAGAAWYAIDKAGKNRAKNEDAISAYHDCVERSVQKYLEGQHRQSNNQ